MKTNEIFLAVKVFHNEFGRCYKHKLIDYIKNGGDLEVRNDVGDTPFIHAIKQGGEYEFLAIKGANVNARDADGNTALDILGKWDLLDALAIAENLVFWYGADLNAMKDCRLKQYLVKLAVDVANKRFAG